VNQRNVVVTGIGLVTALGIDRDSSWQALKAGRNGVGPITAFDTDGYRTTFAAEVKGFDPDAYMDSKDSRKAD